MWLALFAALVNDTRSDRDRRAATREMAQRLNLAADVSLPGTRARLDALLRRVETSGSFRAGVQALRNLVRMVWDDNPAADIRDAEEVYLPDGTRFVFPVPGRRGRLDPYLTWLFEVSQRPDAPSWDEIVELWPSLLDWVGATRPNLSAMSWDAALDASAGWHAQFALHRSDDAPSPGIVVAQFSDGARIERLLSRDNLSDEGDAMGHCVGSHYASVARGETMVFSYRDPNGMPKATWEVKVDPARATALVIGEVLDLEGPENEEVEDRSACKRVPAWLTDTRIPIGEYASKVGLEPVGSTILPTAWLENPPVLSEAARFLDQEVLEGVRPSRFYSANGLGGFTSTMYIRSLFDHLHEEVETFESDLRLLRTVEHLDEEDEEQVTRIAQLDPTWTPERVLEAFDSQAAWDRDREALVPLAATAGYPVDPTDEVSLSNFVYTVGFAMRRAIGYRKDREAIREAMGDVEGEPKGLLLQKAEAVIRDQAERVAALFGNTVEALAAALGASWSSPKETDDPMDLRSGYPIRFAEMKAVETPVGHTRIALQVEKDVLHYEVLWEDDDGEIQDIGSFTDLRLALARAGLLRTVVDVLADLEKAEATLTKHGLVARVPLAAVYGAPKDVIAASKAAGLPIPPALARRFSG
jgi:hypothetical protein